MKYNTIMQLVGCLIIAAMLIPLAVAFVRAAPKSASLRSLRRAFGSPVNPIFNAFNDGTHGDGKISRRADAAHSYRHLLVKTGSDADHIAVAGASDAPLGFCDDTPEAAEDLANVHVLGATEGTVLAVGNEAIAADVDVFTAASGHLQDEPATAGTYYKVGRSVTACSAQHGVFEITPCAPVKLVVVAALTSTDGTAAGAADLAALKAEAEKIGDDVRAIATALATPALVKVLAA